MKKLTINLGVGKAIKTIVGDGHFGGSPKELGFVSYILFRLNKPVFNPMFISDTKLYGGLQPSHVSHFT